MQHNFTTLKQSKRLLKLGLPIDSADCYIVYNSHPYFLTSPFSQTNFIIDWKYVTPCWSVGRLIEIYLNSVICPRYFDHTKFVFPLPQDKEKIMDYVIDRIETAVNLDELCFSELYFSPLE